MILRRIASAIRRQDWFTVLVETMIVVLGVFLGLQVNNWNAARADRADETVYLAALEADVLFSMESLEDLIARMEGQQVKRASLYNYSRDPDAGMESVDLADLLHGGLYQGAPLRVSNTTFESLKSSGRLSLLGSPELASRLQALSERSASLYQHNADELQIMYLFSDPVLVEHFPLGEMFGRETASGHSLIPWLAEIRSDEGPPAFAKSVQFGNVILYRSAFAQQRIRESKELLALYGDILNLIAERQRALGVGP